MAEDIIRNAASMPLAVRVPEACRLTGIGRSKLYELIAAGELPIIKVGSITQSERLAKYNRLLEIEGREGFKVVDWPRTAR